MSRVSPSRQSWGLDCLLQRANQTLKWRATITLAITRVLCFVFSKTFSSTTFGSSQKRCSRVFFLSLEEEAFFCPCTEIPLRLNCSVMVFFFPSQLARDFNGPFQNPKLRESGVMRRQNELQSGFASLFAAVFQGFWYHTESSFHLDLRVGGGGAENMLHRGQFQLSISWRRTKRR